MKSEFYRDTWVEVNLDYIKENVQEMKSRLPEDVTLMAVVKANGYGHGDVQVAQAAIKGGATYLAVAILDEALALRQKGMEVPILVLGASRPENVKIAAENNITLTVFQKQWLEGAKSFLEKDEKIKIHLKLDTGMGRIGIRHKEEVRSIEELILRDERFQLEGVFTHFATADAADDAYFKMQLQRFRELISVFSSPLSLVHTSNSAAAIRYPASYFNGVRFGIAMYGLAPSDEMKKDIPFPLKEAFSLKTRLVHVKKLKRGERISYGGTYEAKEEEWIGTLPIGYADGWLRKLQGQEVLIQGMRFPIVGRICMDQCMIRLPKEYPVGTAVTLIGKEGKEEIPIDEIAARLDTINYEIPCMISSRVPRVYKRSGNTIDIRNSILANKE